MEEELEHIGVVKDDCNGFPWKRIGYVCETDLAVLPIGAKVYGPDVVEALRTQITELKCRLEIDEDGWDGIACRDETIKVQDVKIAVLKAENGQLNTIIHHAKQMEELDTSERDELKRQLAEYKADAERDATLFRNIRKLCGYVENGSDTTFSLFQDDATNDWTVKVGSKSYYSTSAAKAINAAMKEATNDADI